MIAIFTRLTVIIWISTAIIASIAGPFGTYASMTLPVRTVYWTLSIGASIVMARGMRMGVERYLSHLPRTVQDVIVAVGFSTMFTVVVRTVNDLTLDAAMRGRVTVWETFGFVLAVAVIVVLVRRVLGMGTVPVGGHPATPPGSTSDAVESDAVARPKLLDRIGAPAGAAVVRITVDDHYVIVVLDDGSTYRLLMRFADAIAEMAGTDGICVHRSHWVTAAAIDRVSRSGGRETVHLRDGSTVPVSRTYRQNLVDRGLLPQPSRQLA